MSNSKLLWLAGDREVRANWDFLKTDFDLIQTSDVIQAAQMLRTSKQDCVFVTKDTVGTDSLDILEALISAAPLVPIVFYSSTMSAGEVVRLVRSGAYNCFCAKDTSSRLQEGLHQAAEDQQRREKAAQTQADEPGPRYLVGASRAMRDVMSTIRLIGARRCTVLITGETGTGKEMAARELHAASPRAELPMVSVNCAALPENLLEAELFGHVKGAFTGAVGTRVGRFEQANKSTLFLDEIGELPMELQVKLLRVLQEREFQRLGSSETIKVDVRVIAATNCDLQEKVRQGKFREDLYYRVNVVPLRLPPLRDRTGDIPILVDHFVSKICRAEGIRAMAVTQEAKDQLRKLPWPGNVRHLENAVEAAIAMSKDGGTLGPREFGLLPTASNLTVMTPPNASREFDESIAFDQVVNEFQLSLLRGALAKTGGNKTAAADLLGMKRTTLIMKMRGLEGVGTPQSRAV